MTVSEHPTGQWCEVSSGNGRITGADIENVEVNCRAHPVWQNYLKASNAEADDIFGHAVAISGDTLVVGAPYEDSDGSSQDNNDGLQSSAVYVFRQTKGAWAQEAYLKASNSEFFDQFGHGFGCSVAVSNGTLIVGAYLEDSNGSAQNNNDAEQSGAIYVFRRSGAVWTQTDYLKAPNAEAHDNFGYSVAVFDNTFAVGAIGEAGDGSSPDNNDARDSGAVYLFQ